MSTLFLLTLTMAETNYPCRDNEDGCAEELVAADEQARSPNLYSGIFMRN